MQSHSSQQTKTAQAPLIWPPDYTLEFNKRARVNRRCCADRKLIEKMIGYYRENPADWINDWAITQDPRAADTLEGIYKPKLMPFVLFERQREFVDFISECLHDKQSGLVEKSRDIGATWICCAYSVWLWIFHSGNVIGWGSRKEEYVDKRGDPKAVFTKIRSIIDNLPVWQIPPGYDPRLHDNHMRIVNPDNGSAITGEAGDNMGRGGRTTIYFKDESAHYERPEITEAALGDNTDVQIDISSVNGAANIFYRRRMAGELWERGKVIAPGKTRVFIFDWRDHPAKTQKWYDERRAKAEAEALLHIFKQEVDRDYTGSQERVIIPADWARACIDAHKKLGFDDSGERRAAQDVADGGVDKNALGITHGLILKHASEWSGEAGAAARHAIPICKEHNVQFVNYDSIGVGVGFREACEEKDLKAMMGKMKIVAWNAGAKVIDPERRVIPDDRESQTNEEVYANLKAQAWFRFRSRCYKTYMAVHHEKKYPVEELVSFDSESIGPAVHQLVIQLAQAKSEPGAGGKTKVEKKPDGSLSPNLADMTVMLYCPVKPPVGFFDV